MFHTARPFQLTNSYHTSITVSMMLEIAQVVAKRSHCSRAKVGAVVTDVAGLQILGFGYNGQPKGLANECASTEPGQCGCVHAELNALLKAPGTVAEKMLFTTHAPCLNCANAIINSNIASVHYIETYRHTSGLDRLTEAGIIHQRYTWFPQQ